MRQKRVNRSDSIPKQRCQQNLPPPPSRCQKKKTILRASWSDCQRLLALAHLPNSFSHEARTPLCWSSTDSLAGFRLSSLTSRQVGQTDSYLLCMASHRPPALSLSAFLQTPNDQSRHRNTIVANKESSSGRLSDAPRRGFGRKPSPASGTTWANGKDHRSCSNSPA